MAFSTWFPCLSRSWRWFFFSPTGRGGPATSTSLASKSGLGLQIPCGSSFSISSTTRRLKIPSGTSASIVKTRSSCSAEREPLHRSSNRRAKIGKWSALSLRPAAAAWPPNAINPSEQSLIASYRSKPGIDRAEPCDISVAQRNDHDRPMKRFRQPAGDDADHARMPAGRPSTIARRSPRPPSALMHLLGFVINLPLDLLAASVAAIELAGDLACPRQVVGREHLDGHHGPFQPARGVDPRREAKTDRPGRQLSLVRAPLTSISARAPDSGRSAIPDRPCRTITRFSSESGTTSAIVASATSPRARTRKSRRRGEARLPSPKLLQTCQASLNATAAPHRSAPGCVAAGQPRVDDRVGPRQRRSRSCGGR